MFTGSILDYKMPREIYNWARFSRQCRNKEKYNRNQKPIIPWEIQGILSMIREMCAYHGVRKATYSENVACTLHGWSLKYFFWIWLYFTHHVKVREETYYCFQNIKILRCENYLLRTSVRNLLTELNVEIFYCFFYFHTFNTSFASFWPKVCQESRTRYEAFEACKTY